MAQAKKRKRKLSPTAVIKAPAGAPAVAPPPSVDVPPKNQFDARRQELMRERRIISESLANEVRSGFGDRSKRATDRLGEIDKALKQVDADERSADPRERAYKLAVNVGAPIVGMVAGHKLSSSLEAKHVAGLKARNAELKKLATKANHVLKPDAVDAGKALRITPNQHNKLTGIVKAADKLGLNKIKGPLGVLTAGAIIAEGVYARSVLAPKAAESSEHAAELLRGVGTASVFAASSLVTGQIYNNATRKTQLSAEALATIKTARETIQAPPNASTPKTAYKPQKVALEASKAGLASRALKLVSRVATPVVVGVAAATAFSSSSRAGESTSTAAVKGTAAALDTLAMNVPSAANDALKKHGHRSVPDFISSTVKKAFGLDKPKPVVAASTPTPPIASARSHATPVARIASAGRARDASRVTTTKVKAHFKHAEGKGVFTRAHVRIVKP